MLWMLLAARTHLCKVLGAAFKGQVAPKGERLGLGGWVGGGVLGGVCGWGLGVG